MVRLANQYGMVVFLDPIETGGWLETLQANGVTKAYAYGRYLGKRYAKFPNIVWMSGNDFQEWSRPHAGQPRPGGREGNQERGPAPPPDDRAQLPR